MDVAMEMATAATSITADSAGTTIFQPMERNDNGTRRRISEAVAAPCDKWSHMVRTIRQQAQELTKLHRTVGHLANLVEARAAHEVAQRLSMMTWMQEREQKLDIRYKDDKVWGAGMTHMIAKIIEGVAQGKEEIEREREATLRTDGGGLEASQHADTTREVGPEERQQPQQQQPKPKPKLQPVPKLKSTPTPKPTRRWETVPPRVKSQRAPVGPGLAPTE
jgi:hypothetical protein